MSNYEQNYFFSIQIKIEKAALVKSRQLKNEQLKVKLKRSGECFSPTISPHVNPRH